jgi:hypothetical protein
MSPVNYGEQDLSEVWVCLSAINRRMSSGKKHCIEEEVSSASRSAASSGIVKINERTGWSAAILNQFVTEFRPASIIREGAYLEGAIMGQAPIYERINRAGLYSSKARESPRPGPAVMRAGNHLAVVCLSFGAAFAAFVSGSLDQRIGNLFFFGLIPAVGFYAGGYILGQLLVFGVELCDMIMARCFRYAVRLVNDLLSWAGTHVSNLLTEAARTKRSQRN